MIVSARAASLADRDAVERLLEQAVAERSTERGGLLLDLLEPRPPVSFESSFCALGLIDGLAFGVLQAHIDEVAGWGPVAVIDELYVEPDARDVGVGEALMDLALAWAEGAGCAGVDSVVLPGNRAGKNFFERYGLVARAIRVHRPLRSAPT